MVKKLEKYFAEEDLKVFQDKKTDASAFENDCGNDFDLINNELAITGNVLDKIKKHPSYIMLAMKISGDLDLPISKDTFETITKAMAFTDVLPKTIFKDEFSKILTSKNAPRALVYAKDSGLFKRILGEGFEMAKKSELEDFNVLIERMNEARPEAYYRWALIFRRFNRFKMRIAIENLLFPYKVLDLFVKSLTWTDKLYFLNSKMELKRFIIKHGLGTYYFIDRIARLEREIFRIKEHKVEARIHMMSEISAYKEPMSIKGLAINEKDLLDAKIVKNYGEAKEMLTHLLNMNLRRPRLNTKQQLMKNARLLKKFPLLKKLSRVNWSK